MTVTGMVPVCATVNSTPHLLDIFGSGLVYDEKFQIRSYHGTFMTFVLTWLSPYRIQIGNINPLMTAGFYTVVYDGRDLFTETIRCANPPLSGLYNFDPDRRIMQDAYYDAFKKIPNPTIRTALIGD